MNPAVVNQARAAQEMIDAMLAAGRRQDLRAARSLGEAAKASIEIALRELSQEVGR